MRSRPHRQAWRSGLHHSHVRALLSLLTSRLIIPGLIAAGIGVLLCSTGCTHAATPTVHPWQREYLSRRAMRFDADPLELRFRQHMWGSREGSDLGFGQPGGGCGCN
jgi:hypothetical protein